MLMIDLYVIVPTLEKKYVHFSYAVLYTYGSNIANSLGELHFEPTVRNVLMYMDVI